jgi:hypothetical protein
MRPSFTTPRDSPQRSPAAHSARRAFLRHYWQAPARLEAGRPAAHVPELRWCQRYVKDSEAPQQTLEAV